MVSSAASFKKLMKMSIYKIKDFLEYIWKHLIGPGRALLVVSSLRIIIGLLLVAVSHPLQVGQPLAHALDGYLDGVQLYGDYLHLLG